MPGINPTFTEEELQNETWKPIPEYEGIYSLSSLGRVRRDVGGIGTYAGRIHKTDKGFPYVNVTFHKNGVQRSFCLHQLVAKVFLGNCPEGYEVNHIDTCKTNNRVNNLEYSTPKENTIHAASRGLRDNTTSGRCRLKTHCKNGHLLSGDNVRLSVKSSGISHRNCRACEKAYSDSHKEQARKRSRECYLRKKR